MNKEPNRLLKFLIILVATPFLIGIVLIVAILMLLLPLAVLVYPSAFTFNGSDDDN